MLAAGTRVGAYEVVSSLGAGGMGEVYRARDTRLHRDVALKILPEVFASDPDRRARFEREAQALAALNHPNIAAIYGFEDSSATAMPSIRAIVLELVEGSTLDERIAGNPLPLDEALSIARQIADALSAAHEQGIVHRDLKPANIKVRSDDTVKVLDFGLAKMLDPEAAALESASPLAPTVTSPVVTRAGIIMGTAAYMAPEQATGRLADRRADIWAFGVVLYEMLTGSRPFAGESNSEVISEVLKSEPDWSRLPAETPASVRRLLRRCLQKDRARRVRDIADARLDLDESADTAGVESPQALDGSRGRWLLWSATAVALLLAIVQSVRLWTQSPAVTPAPETRLEISASSSPPGGIAGGTQVPESLAISPDGLKVVYSAPGDSGLQLWLRTLDSPTARPLSGTDTAVLPFWSPDSRSIGFFAEGQLKRIDIDGGTIRTLARAPFGVGGAWADDGTILFAPMFSGPLYRTTANGGDPRVVTQLASGQANHRLPRLLSDQHSFLFSIGNQPVVFVGDLNGGTPRRLVDADFADIHVPSNRVLFVRQSTLFSQTVDPRTWMLSGQPEPLAEQVVSLSVSRSGTVVYRTSPRPGQRQFIWFDRSGKELARVGDPDRVPMGDPDVSPDGRSVAINRIVDGNPDIWLLETMRGVRSRFTFEPPANYSPRWSPDGRRLVYNSNRSGVFDLYVKSSSGTGEEELLLATPQNKSASDWSSDGRMVLFRSVDPETSHDLWAMPVDGDRKPFPVVRTNFVEAFGQFSPDGKWIAFQSNESGRYEVYVQPFPGPGAKNQVSTRGGAQMRWRRDGRELFYIGLDSRLMAVPIRSSAEGIVAGEPIALFEARVGEIVPLQSGYNLSYVVAPDGQRFLISTVIEEPAASPISVMLNWQPAK